MWKLLSVMSLPLCPLAMADDIPPKPTVFVECHGRLRTGLVAIGGETTGTTITVNRVVWELRLRDEADREFAEKHNKEPVIVTGTLRKVAGVEEKVRWIIDVKTLKAGDAKTDKEGTRMTIHGMLRAPDRRHGDSHEMTIHADGQIWPVDFSTDGELRDKAESFDERTVLLVGNLERDMDQVTDEEPTAPLVVRVKSLKQCVLQPVQRERD